MTVTPDYFEAMGTSLMRGRFFDEHDNESSPPAVIVDERLAQKFWPDADPIGKRMYEPDNPNDLLATDEHTKWLTVVGVVREVRLEDLGGRIVGAYYYPAGQKGQRGFALAVKTAGDPAGLTQAVRRELQQLDRTMVIYNLAPMSERVSRQVAQSRFTSWLTGVFSGTALLLAMLGIYGVMSYTVTRRTQEIGVRMALGASANEVLTMVVRQGMTLILAGVVIGLALAIGLTRLISTLLFGVTATDPATYAGVTAVLVVVALAATYLPARRATRIDPTTALRYE